jgi:phage terminase large subunit-like protein
MAALEPMTLPHFESFAARLILDTGDPWILEEFQIVMFEPVLAGVRETWTVIPEGNGKTTAMAAFGLYHCMFTRAPWVPVVAAARDQAEIMAQQAYGIIRSTPGLEYNKKTGAGYFEILEGYKLIRCYQNGIVNGHGIKVYAADVNTSDGGIPTLVLCDEGHRWPSLQPYRLWKGKLGKRHDLKHGGGQIVMTSTAGEPGGEFEEQREAIRSAAIAHTIEGCHGHYQASGIVMNEWRLTDPRDATNMAKVKDTNPFSAITEETLTKEFNATTDLGDWKRLKPLAVDTPIPTPEGWTTMLELEVGDEVLNGQGLPTLVRAVTPVRLEESYEIGFSDGATIVAGRDHLWEVEDARNHYKTTVRSTAEMAAYPYVKDAKGRPYSPRWRVRLVGRHVDAAPDLPVDPYVLGAWLGDGTRIHGRVTNADSELWAEIEARGYELGCIPPSRGPRSRVQTLLGPKPVLRQLEILDNKHIPPMYLVASEQERWELLQGLIDTDGTVLEEGWVLFWNTNPRLVYDVRRLVWSLGLACIQREDRALLNGQDYGPRYALEIPCDARHPVTRLPRKRARMRDKGKRCDHRRIRSIVPVGEELVRCIAVDAKDSIFLAGEAMIPTHNCNLPARATAAAITESEWTDAGVDRDIPEGAHIDVGIDVAWKHDTFAIVPLWRFEPGDEDPEREGYRLLGTPKILIPPRDGSTMHPDEVKEAIRELHDFSPIDTAVIDLERAEDIAAWMEDELQITVIDRAQGNTDAIADYDAFMKALRSGKLKHNRDRVLRQHVMNAIARRMPGDKFRFDRPSQSRAKRRQVVRVIDGLTAAAMVNRYAEEDYDFGEPLVAWR